VALGKAKVRLTFPAVDGLSIAPRDVEVEVREDPADPASSKAAPSDAPR
jgi:hypothetical protein